MRKIFKKLKIELCRINLINKFFTNRSIAIHKKKIHAIEETYKKKVKFYSPSDFKYLESKKYDSCHIWGSGSTANHTRNLVKNRKDFFHIGFGFSCLLNINFDFYFIENASKKNLELLTAQNKALQKFIDKKKTILVFKNLWQTKNDPDLALKTYKGKVLFIRDLIVPHYNSKDFVIDNTIDCLLSFDEKYFRGACSTVVNAIIFAKFLGFKKIVLHGIDFHGGYFFDKSPYKERYSEMIPPNTKNIFDKKWRNNRNKHPTANCLELILPKLRKQLNYLYNVKLYTSSDTSGSSKYLMTYFK